MPDVTDPGRGTDRQHGPRSALAADVGDGPCRPCRGLAARWSRHPTVHTVGYFLAAATAAEITVTFDPPASRLRLAHATVTRPAS